MKNIQTSLLSAFESSHLTYDELAKRTNLPKSALYRYINGDTEKIPIDRFQAICAELNVDAGTLLGWKNNIQDIKPNLRMFCGDSKPLANDEVTLVESYRSLTPRGQQLLLDRADELKVLYGKDKEA